ncbi:cytochrome c3 family protein [bacterium]|nr:cytochrome c3 family protein [bacterium]
MKLLTVGGALAVTALAMVLLLPGALLGQEEEDQQPLLEWLGESPHWEPGQEFSAVVGSTWIGSRECLYCHEEMKMDFLATAHARSLPKAEISLDRQGCEACHGAGGGHQMLRSRGAIFAFDWENSEHENNICLRCHEWLTSTREWERTTHAKASLRCSDCHDPHQSHDSGQRHLLLADVNELCISCHMVTADDFRNFSHHPLQVDAANEPDGGVMNCTDCHEVHRGHGPTMLRERKVRNLCLSCHMDKGGPFKFAHMSVDDALGESCMNCHSAHGSANPGLTLMDGRSLCLQCHTDRSEHNAPTTCWTTGCHHAMHGSNNDPFLRF